MKYRGAKVDANQKKIVKQLREIGAIVKHVHQVKGLFDIIVVYRGKAYLTEIKDGEKFPKKFWSMTDDEKDEWIISSLTEGEKKCKDEIESQGVKYHIIYNIETALKMINQKIAA